jgi:CheY-specific phosphatase CheX
MSVYKVERKVDTVIVEMDIDTAEQLVEILQMTMDDTSWARSHYGSQVGELRNMLINNAEVRSPSTLYKADGSILLRPTTSEEMDRVRESRFAL